MIWTLGTYPSCLPVLGTGAGGPLTVSRMSHTIERLRAASDDDLIREHDKVATHMQAGVDYFLDELRRRDQARAMRTSQRLAFASFVLSAINAVLAVVAVVIAVQA